MAIPVPTKYHAVPDQQFPGTWLAQPTEYQGRGFVYVFSGVNAQARARMKAREVNRRLRGKS